MVRSSHSQLYEQTRILVAQLHKKSYKQTQQELKDAIRLYGDDARLYMLKVLLDQIDFHEVATKGVSVTGLTAQGQQHKDHYKMMLLVQEMLDLSVRPNFTSLICRALSATGLPPDFLHSFIAALKLPISQQIQIALGLAQSIEINIQQQGIAFLQSKLAELSELTPTTTEKLSDSLLHDLLYYIQNAPQHIYNEQQKNVTITLIRHLYGTQINANPLFQPLLAGGALPPPNHKLEQMAATPDLLSALRDANRTADLIQDVGYGAMESIDTFRSLLTTTGARINEQEIALILAMMVRTHSSLSPTDEQGNPLLSLLEVKRDESRRTMTSLTTWNIDVFITVMKELGSRLVWTDVILGLDLPGFQVMDAPGWQIILDVYRGVTGNAPFPLDLLFHEWKNVDTQISILRHAILSRIDIFSFVDASRTQQLDQFPAGLSSPPIGIDESRVDKSQAIHAWMSLDLIETLCDLGETDVYLEARTMLKQALDRVPELLVTGLAAVNTRTVPNTLREEFLAILMPMYMSLHPSSSELAPVLHRLWSSNPRLILHWMIKVYQRDRSFANRILELSRHFKDALQTILSAQPYQFAIDLATIASKRDLLKLEKWLVTRLQEHGNSFAHACCEYIRENTVLPTLPPDADANNTQPATIPPPTGAHLTGINGHVVTNQPIGMASPYTLSADTLGVFLKCLIAAKSLLSPDILTEFQSVYTSACQAHPSLAALAASPNVDDIEEEANSYFQKIYTTQLSLEEVVEMLHRFKNSQSKREREVYACMIHNLFDEYRFFHKYPVKELRITAVLFGLLVEHKLVSSFTLGIALRYVLEALRKPEDTKMFQFGMWALEQFRGRLQQWPQYCSLIGQIPHLRQNHPDLVAFLDQILIAQNHAPVDSSQLGVGIGLDQSGDPLQAKSRPGQFGSHDLQPDDGQGMEFNGQNTAFNAGFGGMPQNDESKRQAAAAAAAAAQQAHVQGRFGNQLQPATASPITSATSPPQSPLTATPKPGDPTSTPSKVAAKAPASASKATFGAAQLSIDSLLQSGKPAPLEPSDAIKDKIHFIINNVSKTNLRSKGRELKAVLRPEYYPYFARYLVIKRVSIEPNFQRLYAAFLEAVAIPELKKVMIETTYDNINVLLASDKIVSSSSERSLLKNLGSWLGLLTIARNKPLRAKYLALKELILDAYDQGRLIAIIPFSAKVLESCAESRVFKPPNPWLMALVSLLKEIFDLPALKLNLKFEIEVLFNNLQIAMKDVKPTLLLKDRNVTRAGVANFRDAKPGSGKSPLHQSGFGDESDELSSVSPGTVPLSGNAGPSLIQGQLGNGSIRPGTGLTPSPLPQASSAAGALAASSSFEPPAMIPNLPTFVNISSSIVFFHMYPHLKRCVPTAIDRAIREIISPVVERSVTIACVTTRELIVKDFAMEPDENKMRQAAHQMVQNLTSSLALVTCKEPLRVSINNHLGSLLEANSTTNERQLVEQACLQVSADNLELGCTLIEKAASDRAIREIDETLAPVYQVRRKHRETTGTPYIDMSIMQGRFPASLPEPLRPKQTGLNAAQLRVYEDFARIRQHQQAAASPTATTPGYPTAPAGTVPATGAAPNAAAVAAAAAAAAAAVSSGRHPSQDRLESQVMDASKRSSSGRSTPPSGPVLARPPSMPGAQPGQRLSPTLGAQQAGAAATPAGTASSLTSHQLLDKLLSCLASLEAAVLRFQNHKSIPLHSLPSLGVRDDHEINVLLRMFPAILAQIPRDEAALPRDVVAFTFANKVYKRLYDRENRASLLQIDVHISVLKCIRAIAPKIVNEITGWLFYSEDNHKFILPITSGLIRARMLSLPDVDMCCAKMAYAVHSSGQAIQTTTVPPTPGVAGAQHTTKTVLHPHLEFILALIRRLVIRKPIVQVSEFSNTLDALNKITVQTRIKLLAETLQHLLEDVRTAAVAHERDLHELQQQSATTQGENMSATGNVDGKVMMGGDKSMEKTPLLPVPTSSSHLDDDDLDELDREVIEDDPASLRQQISYLLDDWMNICLQGAASEKIYAQYLGMLQQQRVLASPESTSRFFRIIIQLCIDIAINSAAQPPPQQQTNADGTVTTIQPPLQLSYTAIDALGKLFVFLVKFFEPAAAVPGSVNPIAGKIRLLHAYLASAALVLRRDADHNPTTFNQRPYLRLLNNLLHDLNTPDATFDSNNLDVLQTFGTAFHLLRPSRVPGFTFAWLELISHRMFMSKLLISKSPAGAVLFQRLIVDLFRFMQPYLRNAELTDSIRLVYKGTLRLLLVLLHDFPEFLCEFHFAFCDQIPPSCIQMRNLILSAFPRNMRLPDPFTPNLKVDLLPEISQPPRIVADITAALTHHRHTLLIPLDSYLKNREPASFLKQLLGSLQLTPTHTQPDVNVAIKRAGTTYNVPLINSVVLYVGSVGITNLQNKSGMVSQFQDNACMDVFETLVQGLDAEGRYYVLNSIANQLRYPNNHTHYFSCVLLYLFLQSKAEVIMEQITRVLLERLIVHRPHPWGLLITFIELIKNPRYEFWKQPFTRCAPEIERLFESVARSCMPGSKAPPTGASGAGSPIDQPLQQEQIPPTH